MNRLGIVFLGLSCSAVFLWLALRDVDLSTIGSNLVTANWMLAIPQLVSLVFFYWLKLLRWRTLLSPFASVSTQLLLPSTMVGFAMNNLFPLRVGEIARVFLANIDLSIGRTRILGTLVIERILDVIAVLVLGTGALLLLPGHHDYDMIGNILAISAGSLVAVLILFVYYSRAMLRLLEIGLRRVSGRLSRTLLDRARDLVTSFDLIGSRSTLTLALLNSLIQWGCMGISILIAMHAVGISVHWSAGFVVLAVTVAGIALPSAPGYLGTIEYCFAFVLTPLGVQRGIAVSAAIFYHVLLWTAVVLSGFVCLRHYGLSWNALKERTR